jgi:hypothetical protein
MATARLHDEMWSRVGRQELITLGSKCRHEILGSPCSHHVWGALQLSPSLPGQRSRHSRLFAIKATPVAWGALGGQSQYSSPMALPIPFPLRRLSHPPIRSARPCRAFLLGRPGNRHRSGGGWVTSAKTPPGARPNTSLDISLPITRAPTLRHGKKERGQISRANKANPQRRPLGIHRRCSWPQNTQWQ